MIRIYLSLFLALICHPLVRAQQFTPIDEQSYIEQIHHTIKTTTSDSERLYNNLLLVEYWAPTDTVQSRQYLDKVLLSPHSHLINEGTLLYYQGLYHSHQNEKNRAIDYYQAAIDKLEKNNLLVKAFYNQAYIQVEDKGYDHIVKVLTNQCIPLSKELGDSELLAYCYTQLGLVFMSVGQFETAEEYHFKALEELKKIPAEDSVHLLTYLNLVSNYCYKPDSKTAKEYLDKSAQLIRNYPSSRHYPNYYYQEAMYYTTIQDFPKTLESLNKGIKLAKAHEQAKQLHMLYFRMYNVHVMQKNYPKAKQVLEHILTENILNKEAVNRKITYTQLAAVNNLLGDHQSAYHWLQQSSALGDSLQKIKLLEKMNELEILHQTSEKQQTIDHLEQEKRENELISKNKNLRIIILGIALALSLIIVFLVYRTYKKQEELNKHINISHQQELLHIENERKYEATKAVLQGEEQERQRMAQDLHDSIGGMLANIRMTISKEDSTQSELLLTKLDKTITEMRRISRNLMPETLKNLGLEIALKELCLSMSQDQLYIQFEAFALSKNIPFEIQLALYRITQEGISNIIKYAHANTAIVQISQHDDIINLTIEDDGLGFDMTKTSNGLGIRNIKNRTALLNGRVEITSSQGKGTTINIECHV